MIDHLHSTVAANLVAVDVAKDWNVVLIQEASGRRRSFRFANRFADHNEFVQYLHSLSGTVCIGLEPAGDFHRTIAYRLLVEGFQVVSIVGGNRFRLRPSSLGFMCINPGVAQTAYGLFSDLIDIARYL